jgi:histidyl-tRNA synthetase
MQEMRISDEIRSQFELFGFAPIETPAVERMSVLTAKGGVQRQIFTVGRPEDYEGESTALGLHFDLTVPLARYVAQHANDLVFPFRRYQIQKVWRGERAQRGRFREFCQCDIDVVGSGSIDLLHDAEVPAVVSSTFEAIGIPNFVVHISNRKVLGAIFATEDLPEHRVNAALRIVDKYGSDKPTSIRQDLQFEKFPPRVVSALSDILLVDTISEARRVLKRFGAMTDGIDELEVILDSACQLGVPERRLRFDLSIARGLDYYTGAVYETFIVGNEGWGSVCSGGRYDNLASYFSRRRFPGVGVSIGLTRLVDLLISCGHIAVACQTPTEVLVTSQDREQMNRYLALAQALRASSIRAEVYLDPDSLRDQIAYASNKGIPIAILAGSREFESDTLTIRDLRRRSQFSIPSGEVLSRVKASLRG